MAEDRDINTEYEAAVESSLQRVADALALELNRKAVVGFDFQTWEAELTVPGAGYGAIGETRLEGLYG